MSKSKEIATEADLARVVLNPIPNELGYAELREAKIVRMQKKVKITRAEIELKRNGVLVTLPEIGTYDSWNGCEGAEYVFQNPTSALLFIENILGKVSVVHTDREKMEKDSDGVWQPVTTRLDTPAEEPIIDLEALSVVEEPTPTPKEDLLIPEEDVITILSDTPTEELTQT